MTSVNAVGANAPKFMATTNQQTVTTYGQANSSDPINFSSAPPPASQMQVDNSGDLLSSKCTDGNNDGKVGFAKGAVAVGKGAVKSAWNMVKQLNPLKHPFKFLGAVAMMAVCVAFPPLGVAAAVVGGVTGAVSLAGNAAQVLTDTEGKTDEEQIALLENCGADGLQVGLSVLGAKSGLKAMKGTTGSAMSQLGKKATLGEKFAAFGKDTVSGGRGFKPNGGINTANAGYKGTQLYTHVKGNLKDYGVIDGLKQTGRDGFAKTKVGKEYNSQTDTTKTKGERYNEASEKVKIDKNADKISNAKSKVMDAADEHRKLIEDGASKSKIKSAENRLHKATTDYNEINKSINDSIGQPIKDAQNVLDDAKAGGREAGTELRKLKSEGADPDLIKAAQERLDTAKTTYKEAKTNLESAKTKQATLQETQKTQIAEANAQRSELTTARSEAQTKLKTEQKLLDGLKKNNKATPNQLEAQRAKIAEAQKAYNQAKHDYNVNYGGAIKSNAAKYDAFVKSAGYTSAFGSLTAPAAGVLAAENPTYKAQNLQTAVINSESAQTQAPSAWVTPQLQEYTPIDRDAQMARLNQQLNSVAM